MRNGNTFTMNTPNTEKLGDLLSQLGAILGVGRRSDGKFYLADMCTAPNIKKWNLDKPVEVDKEANITYEDRYNANQGFSISFAPANISLLAAAVQLGASWMYKTPTGWKRMRDFNGYDHSVVKTPFTQNNDAMFGIGRVDNDNYDDARNVCLCIYHQCASEIQPKDIALFNELRYTHYLKMGVLLTNPAGGVTLSYLYNSINEALSNSVTNAVDMPLSVSSDTHSGYKYFTIPRSTAASSYSYMGVLVCVKVNKTTGDMGGVCPLPTEKVMTMSISNPTADVSSFWMSYGGRKPLTLVVPTTQNGMAMLNNIYFTNMFTNLYQFFQSTNLSFSIEYELYYNGGQIYDKNYNKITESTTPLYVSGSGNLAEYTYRVGVRGNTGTQVPIYNSDWSQLTVYLSVKLNNGDANDAAIYMKLDEIQVQPNGYILIPKGTTSRVGYSLQSIMNALGSDNYEIVQSI